MYYHNSISLFSQISSLLLNDAVILKELTNNFHISFLLVQQYVLHFEIPSIIVDWR